MSIRWGLVIVVAFSGGWVACGSVSVEPDAGAADAAVSSDAGADASGACVPADCPGTDDECCTRICDAADECGFSYTAADTALAEQTAGDCRTAVCDGSGGMTFRADSSDVDDGLECTTDACNGDTPTHTNLAAFERCPATADGVCDGAGACLTCVGDANCFSDGTDGAFLANTSRTLASGVHDFTTFTIASGAVVTVTGANPLVIKTQGAVQINGALVANGGLGGNGVLSTSAGTPGAAGPGGAAGGSGFFTVSGGPFDGSAGAGSGPGGGGTSWGPGAGAGHAATGGTVPLGTAIPGIVYGDAGLSALLGGSGGGGGSGGNNCGGGGGGGGGGIIKIVAFGTIDFGTNAAVQVRGGGGGTDGGAACGGGGGGSGGTLWIRSLSVRNDGVLDASGGAGGTGWQSNIGGAGSPGRIRIDVVNATGSGTITPQPGANQGAWYQ
jgi:hypothetical protein